MKRIAIIGLGLIGGSMGLALKAAGLSDTLLVGYSRRQETGVKARRLGAVDEVAGDLASCVAGAGLVILATPVMAMEKVLKGIAPHLKEGCIVTDVASTKAQVMAWAKTYLPDTVSYVGGHPMAGKELAGIEAAEAGLFQGCVYCICPAPGAPPQAVEGVVGLAGLLGARPHFLDPLEHDSFVAGVSHLPILLSTTLVATVTGASSWREMAKLAATGFRDTSRLASSDPVVTRDIFLTNRESLLRWAAAFREELEHFCQLVEQGSPELERRLLAVKEARDRWLRGEVGEVTPVSPFPKEGWAHFFLGRLLVRSPQRPQRGTDGRAQG
jgi:prephenate dehydrogenase